MSEALPVIVKHYSPPGCMDALWPWVRLAMAFVGGALLGYACGVTGG